MAYKLLHVGITWRTPSKDEQIKAVLTEAEDWMFYAGNNWVVYTYQSPSYWAQKIRQIISAEDSLIICEIANPANSDGWMPQWAWDWIQKPRYYS